MVENSNIRPLALQPPNIPLTIRTVTAGDVDALCADCWSHRTITRSRDLIRLIQNAEKFKRGLGIVVLDREDEAHIIAYGQIMRWTQCAEISDLRVSESYRGQGIGTAMIQYLISHISLKGIDCIEIGVAEANTRAEALYRRLGFKPYTTLKINLSGLDKENVHYLRISLTPET